jgi:hypothetical protein
VGALEPYALTFSLPCLANLIQLGHANLLALRCAARVGEKHVATPPNDRIEIVFIADQADPLRLWVQTTAQLVKGLE